LLANRLFNFFHPAQILANYQLIPTCQYPAPADDVQLVREWVASNIASEEYGHGDPSRIVLIGQSAGGAHVATNLYAAGDPSRASTPTAAGNALTPPLAGVVYLSVPFYFDHTKVRRAQTLREYYGSDEVDQWDPRSPVGLFKNLKDDSQVLDAHNLPTFVVIGQLDS
jgi:prenylcysteine alpha-carboxyl methylesterase